MMSLRVIPIVLCLLLVMGCDRFKSDLTRSLEEEKSYSRVAMEYHRLHPEKRKGDIVLETWSTADYIAQAVARQNIPGEWAARSDRLPFLDQILRYDWKGRSFCVIQKWNTVIVLCYPHEGGRSCYIDAVSKTELNGIVSGDMRFSGRSDVWIYVLRLPPKQNP